MSDPQNNLAWTAVTFPKQRFVWFALKNPKVLASTILWISNGGRHYAPWSSRHVNVLGLEEVTGAFHDGLAESARPNPISARGHATVHALHPDAPLTVSYLMACCAVPKGFDAVESIEPDAKSESVRLVTKSGKAMTVSVNWRFVMGSQV